MSRIAMTCLLAVLLGAAGCKKGGAGGSGTGGGGGGTDTEHFRFRPEGGSTTILGKARDRALDAELMNEMRQVKTGLDADFDGMAPADKAGWVAFLRDYKALRKLVNDGEVVAYNKININRQAGPGNTVLMYEQRVVKHNDGLVLTCDGTPHRMNKAQFDALAKPR